jgi:hypothetical protein
MYDIRDSGKTVSLKFQRTYLVICKNIGNFEKKSKF